MISRYKKYPEYKDSGVEWLGEIPKDWSLNKHKFIAKFFKGRNPEIIIDEKKDNSIKYLSMDYLRGNSLPKYAYKNNSLYITSDNQILLIWDGSNAGEFIKAESGILSSTMAASEIVNEINRSFYWYFCNCIEKEMRKHATGMGIPHVNGQELRSAIFPFPTSNEQSQIADFLDYETSKIDTLIEKQQKLIELLKEKRQAVISHAVTKGLNPNAPMKDSGVEWLGEVPEHWDVKRFKNIFNIEKRIAGTLGYDVLSITQKGIKVKDIESGDGQLSMDYSKYQLVFKGDFAMNQMDLITGFVDISKFDGVTSPDYRVFSLIKKKCCPMYFLYFLQMCYINKLFFPFGQGAAHIGRWRLPTAAFNDFLSTFPSESEQFEISNYITEKLDSFYEIESKAVKQVKLLKERRTSLISAAVTGKIDVRDWKKPE